MPYDCLILGLTIDRLKPLLLKTLLSHAFSRPIPLELFIKNSMTTVTTVVQPSTSPNPWPTLSSQERDLVRSLMDYGQCQGLPEIWPRVAATFGDRIALEDPHSKPAVTLNSRELLDAIQTFGAALHSMGIRPQGQGQLPPCVSLFADNSPRWFIADQGLMTAGVANAVRSSQADPAELLYILNHSQSRALVVENWATWKRVAPLLDQLEQPLVFGLLLTDEAVPEDGPCPLFNFSQWMERGRSSLAQFQPWPNCHGDLATLIYTSGTTGKPKGVMLTHGNLLSQVYLAGTIVQPEPGDRVLSILPTWHSYERTVEYFLLAQGCHQIYTSIRHIKKDLSTYRPQYMVSVPRIWESLYEGIQQQFRSKPEKTQRLIQTLLGWSQAYLEAKRTAQNVNLNRVQPSPLGQAQSTLMAALLWPLHRLGDRLVYKTVREKATGGAFKQAISGGGSLARHLETFFETIGVEVLVGYGLTETSPILTVRRSSHNVRGSSGLPLAGTEIRIVNPETRTPLGLLEKGLVLARGPQIMAGYFANPEATAKAIDPDGWFDTGDLGMVIPQGDLVLTGRAKDTIVLTNGENIEPQPIEDACLRSPYIDQIMLVGQDQKQLGALIVPNLAALHQWAISQALTLNLPQNWEQPLSPEQVASLQNPALEDLYRRELTRQVQDRPSYRPDDRIGVFRLIGEPFSISNGLLTQTLKIRRPVVTERYQAMIDGMFSP